MLVDVRACLERERLVLPGTPLWVAVSGGIDSMVLLHVLRALGHPCSVAHVDHGLRGAESDGDATFVEEQAARQGLTFRSLRVDPLARMQEEGGSLQMAARSLRYQWFSTLLREGPGTMALGHHRDDAVETLLLHLLRGPGVRGWASIPALTVDEAFPAGAYVRPLLGVDRAAIRAYAEEHGIPFREDSSNGDDTYLRNQVRHEVLPLLERMRPGAARALGRSVATLRDLATAARTQTLRELQDVVSDVDGTLRLPFRVLEASRTPRLLLLEWVQGRGLHPEMIDRVLQAVMERATGACFHVGTGTLTVDRDALLLVAGPHGFPSFHIDEEAVPARLKGFDIAWCGADAIDLSHGMDVAWLDAAALRWPLELRPWREGDRMRPIGLHGSKLVSDILVDAKVPMPLKAGVHVLVSGGEIAWLAGHRVAEGYSAFPAAPRVLRIARMP